MLALVVVTMCQYYENNTNKILYFAITIKIENTTEFGST